MKIALAPDLHCYYNTYDKFDEEGNSRRKTEWEKATTYMYEKCVENGVDIVIFPGDYFVTPKPNADKVLMVSHLFRKFEDSKIKVLGTLGNHDVAGANTKSMDEVVSAIGGNEKWCISTFDYVKIRNVGFAFLPYVKRPEILANNPDYANMEISEQLIQIAGGLRAKMSEDSAIKKTVLVGHWSIQGSITSSGRSMERTVNGVEVVLPLGDLVSQGWDAILFGHIHKPQVLSENAPFVAYSGCVQRINIGEANDKRGFFIYDTVHDEHEFIEIPSIEMKVFRSNIGSSEDVDLLMKEIQDADIKDKIVHVGYDISKEYISLVDRSALVKMIEEKNPLKLVGISPRILEVARQRDGSVTESLNSRTALETWLKNQNIIDSEQQKVLNLFAKYQQRRIDAIANEDMAEEA